MPQQPVDLPPPGDPRVADVTFSNIPARFDADDEGADWLKRLRGQQKTHKNPPGVKPAKLPDTHKP